MKKLLVLLLVIAIMASVLGSMPITTFALENDSSNELLKSIVSPSPYPTTDPSMLEYLTFDAETGIIIKCDTSISGELVIPAEIDGVAVTEIGSSAFASCKKLTRVTIPGSVKKIENYAFYNNWKLETVTIYNGVISIGDTAFGSCKVLTSVSIPDSVTSIDNDAFYNCPKLTDVILPRNLTELGDYAFKYCTALTNITIPRTLSSIPADAFYGDTNLTSVTIEDGVKSIGTNAFYGCKGLTEIDLPESVESISDNVFANCEILKKVIISKNVTNIGANVFSETSEGFAIYGYGDSYAKTYADENRIAFVDIAASTPTPTVEPTSTPAPTSTPTPTPIPTSSPQVITVEPPTVSVESGEVEWGTTVTISPTAGLIAYSVNGGEYIYNYEFSDVSIIISESTTLTVQSIIDNLEEYDYIFKKVTYTYTVGDLPIEISNAEELKLLADTVNSGNTYEGKTIVLSHDIDLSAVCGSQINDLTMEVSWKPIGMKENCFNGTFDGRGYTVKGLYINSSYEDNTHVGLFGYAGDKSVIKNLTVDGHVQVNGAMLYPPSESAYCYVGAITGFSCGKIENCHNKASVQTTGNTHYSAGICGRMENSLVSIVNCINTGNISSETHAGAIICSPGIDISVKNCYYLEGCLANNNIEIRGAEVKTAEQFNSGEVAYLLGDAWGQEIGMDKYPILGGDKVYFINNTYTNKLQQIDIYPYIINSIILTNENGAVYETAPNNKNFIVNFEVTKNEERNDKDYFIVALYGTDGSLLSFNYLKANIPTNESFSCGINIPRINAEIDKIKVFVWNSLEDMFPLAESNTY